MNREKLEEYLEGMPACKKCEEADLRLIFEDMVLIGCDEHITEIAGLVSNSVFFKKYITSDKESKAVN
jgi:hypothetical protein